MIHETSKIKIAKGLLSFAERIANPISLEYGAIKDWIDFCIDRHELACTQVVSEPTAQTKVIDCISRKIVPAAKGCKYFCLGYVWGKVEHPAALNPDHLPTSCLKTFEDAIEAVKWLGYCYLCKLQSLSRCRPHEQAKTDQKCKDF